MYKTGLFSPTWSHMGRLAAAIGVAAMVASVSLRPAAQAAPARAVSLSVWSGISGPDQVGFKQIIDAFNKSQSAVRINYDQQAFSGYGPKLATALSANKGPNIWTMDAAGSLNYEVQGQMADLNSSIKSSKILQKKNFPSGVWNQGLYKGHMYLIPLDTVPLMMYYDKSLLKKAGYSKPVLSPPSKVLAAARKLTKGTSQYGLVIPTDWPMQFLWPTVLAQFGGTAFNTKTKQATFNSAAGVQALTYLHDLIYKYHTGPDKYATDQDLKMLANGSAAQVFDGIWQYTHPTFQTLGKNLGFSRVPQFGPKKAVYIGDLYFMAYKNDSPAQLKAAVKFFEFFQTHAINMAKTGPVPTYKPLLSSKAFKKLTASSEAAKELSYGVFSIRYPGYDDHWMYDDAVWPVVRGQTTNVKAALDKAAAEVTAHIQNGGA